MNETIRTTQSHRSIRSYADEPASNEILTSGATSRPRGGPASGFGYNVYFS